MNGSILGAVVKRAEDPRLITGAGTYVDNMGVEGAVWLKMVRSPVPHGRIAGIDTGPAGGMPGVVGVFTAPDLGLADMRSTAPDAPAESARPIIARDVVRFAGEIVAVVAGETPQAATDAAEAVWAEIDPLPAAATPAAAQSPGAPVLFPGLGTNVVLSGSLGGEADVLGQAQVVVDLDLVNQRMAAVPLEPNNALAVPRAGGGLDMWLGSQGIHAARNNLSAVLAVPREDLHLKVPDMGGGFGAKIGLYPEQVLVAALALRLGRPVRWQETRSENMVAMSHGRAQYHHARLGLTQDGTITGLWWRVTQDAGAYPLFGAYLPHFTMRMASGPYRIPAIDFSWQAVVTTTTPVHAYRGAGRPEATMTLERLLDLAASRLDIDPAELRRRNLIPASDMPAVTATGERYDSGDYAAALDLALDLAGYPTLRADQARRRSAGDRRQLGIGLSTYVEVTAPANRKDWGAVEVDGSRVTVSSGASAHGQGHETTFAQITSQVLKVPLSTVRLLQGDTDTVASGGGTMGSRSMQMAGSAVLRAGVAVVEKARRVAARVAEASIDDIVQWDDGRIGVAGVPDTGRSIFELATLAADPANLPEGEEPGLRVEDRWSQEEATVPFGTHVSVVEVDTDTGDVTVLRHIACDDCGVIFSRMIVDGQVQGGVAQGIGQALLEGVGYDADANPTTTNLTTYLIPTSLSVPLVEIDHTETPTDQNPLGAKGIGESGTVGSGPAVVNAVHDALRPLGVTHLDMPLTPARIWEAIRAAAANGAPNLG